MSTTSTTTIPTRTDQALCECGCGEPAPVATRNDQTRGYVKGQPKRFVRGHHARLDNPMRGKTHGDETRAKIREAWTEERRARQRAAQIARMADPEHVARMNATYLANQLAPRAWIEPNEAQAFLIGATANGPAVIRPTKHRAHALGFTDEQLKDARLALGLVSVVVDGKRCWARPSSPEQRQQFDPETA